MTLIEQERTKFIEYLQANVVASAQPLYAALEEINESPTNFLSAYFNLMDSISWPDPPENKGELKETLSRLFNVGESSATTHLKQKNNPETFFFFIQDQYREYVKTRRQAHLIWHQNG